MKPNKEGLNLLIAGAPELLAAAFLLPFGIHILSARHLLEASLVLGASALLLKGWVVGGASDRREDVSDRAAGRDAILGEPDTRILQLTSVRGQVNRRPAPDRAPRSRTGGEAGGKNIEERLRQSQKMEAMGQLAGGVAHDFNNILTVIGGYSDLLLAGLEEGHPSRRHAEEIKKAGERAASLTRQLLAFSRQHGVERRVVDLNLVVANVEKMLRRLIGEDIELLTIRDRHSRNVKADVGQLEQLLMNLAVNARDAMPEGGKLVLETGESELEAPETRTGQRVRPGRYVRLAVSDTGCGMDAETRQHIFEPFFTTKEKGTGLGLATVYGIVRQNGGYIGVYSEVGYGTTFSIYLPCAEEGKTVAAPGPMERLRRPAHGSETVMVVEDEDTVRSLVRGVLQGYGYQVLEASQGEDALRLARRHTGAIHLCLTDVVMPHMNGCQLAEQLTATRPETRVLYMSGYTQQALAAAHNVHEPIAPYLEKPFEPAALARKVREVLDAPTRLMAPLARPAHEAFA